MTNSVKSVIRTGFHTVGRIPPMPWLTKSWQGGGAILGYHRVVSDDEFSEMVGPYKDLCCSLSRFRNQMMFLRAAYQMVSMDMLCEHLCLRRSGFVVAVTFDDGYIDNDLYVLPILEELKIPATLFITTRFPEGDTKMWWFDLWNEIYLRDSVEVFNKDKQMLFSTKTMSEKQNCYKKLSYIAMQLGEKDLWEWLGEIKNNFSPLEFPELVCSWQDLSKLSESPLITVGAHSHNHSVLSLCTTEELDIEMKTCKELIENRLNVEVKHFAYPYGGRRHFGERECLAAKNHGYQSAVTTVPGKLVEDDMYSLGRHLPHDFTANYHMANKLGGWNNLIRLSI